MKVLKGAELAGKKKVKAKLKVLAYESKNITENLILMILLKQSDLKTNILKQKETDTHFKSVTC